jgi:ferredoxin
MSVEITFEPVGLVGLVAEGSYLSNAARRMGVSLDCAGTDKCTSCQVRIQSGAELLSGSTETERTILGEEGLGQQLRLACHVVIERPGQLVVYQMSSNKEKTETKPNDKTGIHKEFAELPLEKKIATLFRFEVATMAEALNAVVEKPMQLGERLFDRIYDKAKTAQKEARSKRQGT